jgi:hypothetical protein
MKICALHIYFYKVYIFMFLFVLWMIGLCLDLSCNKHCSFCVHNLVSHASGIHMNTNPSLNHLSSKMKLWVYWSLFEIVISIDLIFFVWHVLVVEKKGVRVIRLANEHPMNHYSTWVHIVFGVWQKEITRVSKGGGCIARGPIHERNPFVQSLQAFISFVCKTCNCISFHVLNRRSLMVNYFLIPTSF